MGGFCAESDPRSLQLPPGTTGARLAAGDPD